MRDLALVTGIEKWVVVGDAVSLPSSFSQPTSPDTPPLVVNVATVQHRKGPDLFVEIASKVCAVHPTVTFVWIGRALDRRLLRELESRIEVEGLSSRIGFVGPVDPPYEWMTRASALLLTSRSEAFGLVVAEAMACYRTVFCFADTGAEYVVGDTGEVLPPFDVDLGAAGILEYLERPASDRINHRARERYESLFSPEKFGPSLAQVLAGSSS